jgi:hypothetical protein
MVKEITSKNRNKNTTLYCIKKLMRFFIKSQNARKEENCFLEQKFSISTQLSCVLTENSILFIG